MNKAKKFAQNYVNELHRYKAYQRNRIESSSIENPEQIITDLNRMVLTGDKNQTALKEYN